MRIEPVATCHVCGAAGELVHPDVTDQQYGKAGRWGVRGCTNAQCGLLWLDPRPIEAEIHRAYTDYYTHAQAAAPDSSGRGLARAVEQFVAFLWLGLLGLRGARRRIDLMYLDTRRPGRVLDIGCGDGAQLAALAEHGWAVEGQEVDPAAAQHAQERYGLTVHLGDLRGLDLPTAGYDAIIMSHVLEHVHDPRALLRECRRLLAPGGVLVAVSPNPSSYGHARYGASWFPLDPPRHLHLFTPAAARALAEQAGFETIRATTTTVHANVFLASSRNIRTHGSHDARVALPARLRLIAMWEQLLARLAFARSRTSGEETVLEAS